MSIESHTTSSRRLKTQRELFTLATNEADDQHSSERLIDIALSDTLTDSYIAHSDELQEPADPNDGLRKLMQGYEGEPTAIASFVIAQWTAEHPDEPLSS